MLAAAWLVFFVWTLRRLWRPINSQYSKLVFFCGVKGIGVGGFVLTLALITYESATVDPDVLRAVLVSTAVLGPPLFLWAGYVSGRLLALVLGVRPDS